MHLCLLEVKLFLLKFKQSHSDEEFNQEVDEFLCFDDGDPNNDSDSDEELDWQGDCVQSCQPKYEKIHEKSQIRKFRIGESRQLVAGFRAKITRMKAKFAGLETQNRRLRADLAAARASASGPPRRTIAVSISLDCSFQGLTTCEIDVARAPQALPSTPMDSSPTWNTRL